MKFLRLLPLISAMAWQNLSAAIVEKPLEYASGDVTSEGWQAYDDQQKGPRPGILIIHQWTGVSDHEKAVAKKLAEMGYRYSSPTSTAKAFARNLPRLDKKLVNIKTIATSSVLT